MSIQNLAARFLRVTGALLVLLGIVHLVATPHIPHLLDRMSTREAYRFAWGPTMLNHVLVGILLIPLGFTTWLASSPGNVLQSWARQVLIVNAIVFSTIPLSIVAFMRDPASGDWAAKLVAIDMPGSATERTLQWLQWIVSVALFVSIGGTAGIVAYNVYYHAAKVLSLAWSGVTFVVITGCAMLLLYFAQLIDPRRRVYTYAAVLAGLLGTLAFFLLLGKLGINDDGAPIVMFFGSTMTATAVLVLIGLSGFKAR